MSKTVAEVIVETLQAAGVKRCWGVPGDTLNYFTDAIRRSKIEWVHVDRKSTRLNSSHRT